MPRAKRICAHAGCPAITDGRYCTEHARQHERARGTRQQRGYDRDYDRARRKLEPLVKAGRATCWRCHLPIHPGTRWNLGHSDDRTRIMGPEHELCNLSAAGKAAHPDPA